MKDRLLDAAYEILSEEGSAALTTRRVCDAVGITMPTLYHYFSSRDALVRAVHDAAFQRFMTKKRNLKPTDDPLLDLRRSCDLVLDFVQKDKNVTRAVMARGLEEPGMFAAGYELLRSRVRRAGLAGTLRVTEHEATAMTWSVVQGLVIMTVASPDPSKPVGSVRKRLLDGLFAAI